MENDAEKPVEVTKNQQADDSLDQTFTEWATQIYRAADNVYRASVALCSFETKEQLEKFRKVMCEKFPCKFVAVIKSQHFLYLKIGNYELNTDYHPSRYHISQIKKILMDSKGDLANEAQAILAQINDVLMMARLVRRNILYPEFEEMEKKIDALKYDLCFQDNKIAYLEDIGEISKKEIAKLKETIKEKNQQLQTILGMWAHLSYEINSSIMRGTELYYIMRNKLGQE